MGMSGEGELSSELAEIDLNRGQRSGGSAANAIRGEGNDIAPDANPKPQFLSAVWAVGWYSGWDADTW